jgi:hypothetical protein
MHMYSCNFPTQREGGAEMLGKYITGKIKELQVNVIFFAACIHVHIQSVHTDKYIQVHHWKIKELQIMSWFLLPVCMYIYSLHTCKAHHWQDKSAADNVIYLAAYTHVHTQSVHTDNHITGKINQLQAMSSFLLHVYMYICCMYTCTYKVCTHAST